MPPLDCGVGLRKTSIRRMFAMKVSEGERPSLAAKAQWARSKLIAAVAPFSVARYSRGPIKEPSSSYAGRGLTVCVFHMDSISFLAEGLITGQFAM